MDFCFMREFTSPACDLICLCKVNRNGDLAAPESCEACCPLSSCCELNHTQMPPLLFAKVHVQVHLCTRAHTSKDVLESTLGLRDPLLLIALKQRTGAYSNICCFLNQQPGLLLCLCCISRGAEGCLLLQGCTAPAHCSHMHGAVHRVRAHSRCRYLQ